MKISIDLTQLWLLVALAAVLMPAFVYGRAADILQQDEGILDTDDVDDNETGLTDREILQLIKYYINLSSQSKSKRFGHGAWNKPLDPLGNGLTGYSNFRGSGKRTNEKRSELYEDSMNKREFEDALTEALEKSKRFGGNRVMDSLSTGFRGHGIGTGKRR